MPEGKLLKKASLEERIKCILHMPALEMDGNAFKGKYELNDFGSIKDFIFKKLRLDEKGKNITYTNQSTGDKIIISGSSAGKLALHWKDGEAYQKTIAYIPQIIEKMQFLDIMPADKAGSKFKEYSYYIIPVKIGDETYTVLSTVGHNEYGVYYDQNVFKGTPKDVFAETKNEIANLKYDRLNDILGKLKGDSQSPIPVATGGSKATP